ncbi:MAG: hypothetical protein DWQ06_09265 [Calditrichaeota bacterium]|nr:MAG: hypothetical protein DWQ06_09265 [Calditrichota bacterium]
MELVTIIGSVAGILTTFAFLPQAIKTWKTKSTKDISLVMFSSLNIGVLLWLIYGIMLDEYPIILANLVTLIFSLPILWLKIKYK